VGGTGAATASTETRGPQARAGGWVWLYLGHQIRELEFQHSISFMSQGSGLKPPTLELAYNFIGFLYVGLDARQYVPAMRE